MTSKNPFAVLARRDSDDDIKPKVSQKAQRAANEKLRETYQTSNLKQQNAPEKRAPRPKDDYAPGEKRPYERHSGTGRQAFGNNFKKGGYGKGNVGREGEDNFAEKGRNAGKNTEHHKKGEEKAEEAVEEKAPEQPKEEIILLDAYIKESGITFGLQKDAAPSKAPKIEDPDLKPIASTKVALEETLPQKKRKNLDSLVQSSGSAVAFQTKTEEAPRRHHDNKPKAKKNFTDEDFPQLK